MSRPSAGLLNLIAAATFAIIGVLQLTSGHSDGWLSFVASVLLVNAARTSPRRKPGAGG
jgi:hypothetical protein